MSKTEALSNNICVVPDSYLREHLTPLQYEVVKNQKTEPPFQNEYWDNHKEGLYVDVLSAKALFASVQKYDSGSGWPSFWAPIDEKEIQLIEDLSYGMNRIEVKSASSGAHLGHVFTDGPEPTGKRYCINSSSLRFILKEDLIKNGYENYLYLFK